VEGGSLPAMAQAAGIESFTWRTRERLAMTFPRACSALHTTSSCDSHATVIGLLRGVVGGVSTPWTRRDETTGRAKLLSLFKAVGGGWVNQGCAICLTSMVGGTTLKTWEMKPPIRVGCRKLPPGRFSGFYITVVPLRMHRQRLPHANDEGISGRVDGLAF
jgi:hypothetical protein